MPVLELENGLTIVESASILLYLAQGTPYLPEDPHVRAEVTSWLFFEQADLQRAIAVPRVWHLHGLASEREQEIQRFHAEGYPALEKLDQWLLGRTWLVGASYTIADIGVFAYVSLATQGGYEMERFASIREWIARVKSQPAWVELMPDAR